MSIVDISEELVSEVDIHAEFTQHGMRISVIIDDVEIHDECDYEIMAYDMVADQDKYPTPVLNSIRKGLANMVDILEGATVDEK
jgi:hypothetical protein